jgi:hypothetical protein
MSYPHPSTLPLSFPLAARLTSAQIGVATTASSRLARLRGHILLVDFSLWTDCTFGRLSLLLFPPVFSSPGTPERLPLYLGACSDLALHGKGEEKGAGDRRIEAPPTHEEGFLAVKGKERGGELEPWRWVRLLGAGIAKKKCALVSQCGEPAAKRLSRGIVVSRRKIGVQKEFSKVLVA